MQRSRLALLGLVFAATLAANGAAAADPYGPDNGQERHRPLPPRPEAVRQEEQRQEEQRQQDVRRENSLGADWRQQQNEVRQGVRQRRLVPLTSVIEQLGRRIPGRQLDAGLEYQGDRPVYRVRWMTRDGRRVDYLIDATTGAILGGG